MQRINLWPNPKFDPTGFHVVKKGGDISKYMTGGTLANTRGEYIDLPFACEVGVEYVCTYRIVSNDTTNKSIGIFSGSTVKYPSAQTVGKYTIRFTPTANDTRLAIPSGMAISELSVEAADTYDAALGGASGLLLGGHDATRLRRFVGRVMSDDGHEPDKQSKRPRHAETGRVHADYDHREDSGYQILVHGLVGRVGRLRHGGQLSGHLQQEPTHRMVPHVHERESDEPEIQGRVRQSDRQGVGHGHVRAGRIPGEQSLARRPLLFRRGYDAARLTPMGVVA